MDAPGIRATPAFFAAITYFFQQLNGLEFARVRFDGGEFTHGDTPTLQGSRASYQATWHSWSYFKKAPNGGWDRPRDAQNQIITTYNELDQGLKAFNPNPDRA